MCAKLRTVAASNNRDHPTRSLSSSPFASTINCSPGSQALLEVTHQDHSIGITLLLLVRATYIYFCSSRTSRSWWIPQSTQHNRRGCKSTRRLPRLGKKLLVKCQISASQVLNAPTYYTTLDPNDALPVEALKAHSLNLASSNFQKSRGCQKKPLCPSTPDPLCAKGTRHLIRFARNGSIQRCPQPWHRLSLKFGICIHDRISNAV